MKSTCYEGSASSLYPVSQILPQCQTSSWSHISIAQAYITRAEIHYCFVSELVISASQKALRFWNIIGVVCSLKCTDRQTDRQQGYSWGFVDGQRVLDWFHSSLRKHWRQGSYWACVCVCVWGGHGRAKQTGIKCQDLLNIHPHHNQN